MELEYIEGKTFYKIDFVQDGFPKGEYENCSFLNCDFSNSDLSGSSFSACEFSDCNLSLAKLVKTALINAQFKGCKLLGLHFGDCSEFVFSVHFDTCTLNHSSFYKLKLKKMIFKNSKLEEVDFTDCDLSGAIFDQCDLRGATFENTLLEKADFRTAVNYSLDPEMNRIKKAKFSLPGIPGLLNKYDIVISAG